MSIKHIVNGTPVATIVEVLQEMDVANKLNYPNDKYTGTPIYSTVSRYFISRKPMYQVGTAMFYPKSDIVNQVRAYLDKKSITPEQKKAKARLRNKVANLDPNKAIFIEELIKQALASTK